MSAAPAAATASNVCPQCGARFRCGMEAGDAQCWCAALSPLMPVPPKSGPGAAAPACLCPDCLRARLSLAGANRG